mmetsp:Transcript_28503/g.68057  ORF Transcript_28503/g.68057 Transcript_28503/m.68057 type:complete len:212 (+) Transcript_28503:328-963(+)
MQERQLARGVSNRAVRSEGRIRSLLHGEEAVVVIRVRESSIDVRDVLLVREAAPVQVEGSEGSGEGRPPEVCCEAVAAVEGAPRVHARRVAHAVVHHPRPAPWRARARHVHGGARALERFAERGVLGGRRGVRLLAGVEESLASARAVCCEAFAACGLADEGRALVGGRQGHVGRHAPVCVHVPCHAGLRPCGRAVLLRARRGEAHRRHQG